MSRIFIIAGEVSGDTHAAGLMRELKSLDPAIAFAGLGGPRMREAGGDGIEDWLANAAVLGLWEVLKHYGYFHRKFSEARASIATQQPDAVILIDYPGFNLRIAKKLRRTGFSGRIIYYISPQVWAWKRGRIKTMAKVLDLMICIFPFEEMIYERSGLAVKFAGHPIVDRVQQLRRNWPREPDLVGFFPGSRLNEVRRLFPVMMETAKMIQATLPGVRFAVSAANEVLASEMRELAERAKMPEAAKWIETGSVYDLMQRAQVGAVASGTATLEAACFGLPYALVYHVNWLTYEVGRRVVKIDHLGIVNILASKEIVHEYVQHNLTPENLSRELIMLLTDPIQRAELQRNLTDTVATLGEGRAYARAARAVMECLAIR